VLAGGLLAGALDIEEKGNGKRETGKTLDLPVSLFPFPFFRFP